MTLREVRETRPTGEGKRATTWRGQKEHQDSEDKEKDTFTQWQCKQSITTHLSLVTPPLPLIPRRANKTKAYWYYLITWRLPPDTHLQQ